MIKFYTKIIGVKVLNFETGDLLAVINDIIIDPENGKIIAFWVKSLEIPSKNTVIMSNSIVKWSKNIYIKDSNDVFEAGDSIRLTELLSKEIFFIGAIVKSEDSTFLGYIYDVDFDSTKLYLRNIYTSKNFLIFPYDKRIFSWNRIIKALKDYIIIKDDSDEKIKIVDMELVKN